MKLLLFNPETEYALASGASFYTPPARVEQMRREHELLPEAWAKAEDIILVDDPKALKSTCRLASWSELALLFKRYPDMEIEPWGWNPALIRRFVDAGVPSGLLPDHITMNRIRELAHRRTTITINTLWNQEIQSSLSDFSLQRVDGLTVDIPKEFTCEEECMEFLREVPGCWFKAPWSSSGRGVINTAADMTAELVRQWCHGIIRRQGSVMGETPGERKADFASEWMIEKSGEARFLGLSCFHTSNRGKYVSNDSMTQCSMRSLFDSMSSIPVEKVIRIQRRILEQVLVGYHGPCGVDMLIEHTGHLRPFVELNLRRTMGMLHCEC